MKRALAEVAVIGIPAAALTARLAIPAAPWGWRLVFVWGALGLIFPFLARRLEESPRWYEKRGRFAESIASYRKGGAFLQGEQPAEPPESKDLP